MLRVLRSGDGGLYEVNERDPAWALPSDAAWVDLVSPTREEEVAAELALGIQLPTREEMAEIEVSSRLYQEDGAHFMTAFVLVGADGEDPTLAPITFVLASGRLATIRYVEPRAFVAYIAQATRDADFCTGGTNALLGLLDALVDRLADILETASADVDGLSGEIFDRDRKGAFKPILRRLGRSQAITAKARSSLVSLARLVSFASLAEEIASLKDNRERLRSLQRDIQSLTDHSAYLTENLTFLLDSATALINTDQNEIMKVFSIWAVVLMPPTLIASVFGMNFEHIPGANSPLGFGTALLAMIATMVFALWWFRRRGWL